MSSPTTTLHLFDGVIASSTPLPGPRAKALVLALALANGRGISSTALVEEVWGDDAPASPATALHTMISRIRQGQGHAFIRSTATGYALSVPREAIDFWAASELCATAKAALATPETALKLVAAAQALMVGDPAAGTSTSPVLEDFLDRVSGLRNELTLIGAEANLAAGNFGPAAAALEQLTAKTPLDEPLQASYLQALAGAGSLNAALAAYDALRRRLRKELGSEPSVPLQRIYAQLLAETSGTVTRTPNVIETPGDALPGPDAGSYSYGLRAAPNELLGRAADVAAVEMLMGTGRLTTVLGIGGLGKTRMAQELARRAWAGRSCAVIFVELAGIRTPADLWLALAEGTGLRETRSTRALQGQRTAQDLRTRTLTRLARQSTLLVLDNCEHLVEQAAAAVAEILALCPDTTVVTTSRAPLNIAGERIYQLQPLAIVARAGAELPAAVELFNERALAARPTAHLEAVAVTALCQQVDGLPLAIELAAAKVRLMSVEDIARRLQDSFSLLVNPDRSAPERHRTLAAVIDWSWELLDTPEQVVARRVSVFPSGFSLESASALVAAIPDAGGRFLTPAEVEDAVEALLNQSLILAEDNPATATLRFRMLETVREYSLQKLHEAQEGDAANAAMVEWASEFGMQALANSAGPRQLATIAAVTADQENLLHALRLAMTDGGASGSVFAIFAALSSYWTQRGMHSEVFSMAAPVMAATKSYQAEQRTMDSAVFALSVMAVTTMIYSFRNGIAARARLRHINRSSLVASPRYDAMNQLIMAVGDEQSAETLMATLRADSREDVASLAFLLSALWAENNGSIEIAVVFAERAYELAERQGDTWAAGSAADLLCQLFSQSAKAVDAIKWAWLSIERMKMLGADPDVRQGYVSLALNHAALGNLDQARDALETAKTMAVLGQPPIQAQAVDLAAEAEIAFATGDVAEGLRVYRSIDARGYDPRSQGPVGQIMTATQICAELLFNPDVADDAGTRKKANSLRLTVLAQHRIAPSFMDRPVIGTSALALGAWHAGTAEPGSRQAAVGLELVAMAAIMKSRQDETVLHRERHEAAARDMHGAAAWDAAMERVEQFRKDSPGATAALLELLHDPSLRLP